MHCRSPREPRGVCLMKFMSSHNGSSLTEKEPLLDRLDDSLSNLQRTKVGANILGTDGQIQARPDDLLARREPNYAERYVEREACSVMGNFSKSALCEHCLGGTRTELGRVWLSTARSDQAAVTGGWLHVKPFVIRRRYYRRPGGLRRSLETHDM